MGLLRSEALAIFAIWPVEQSWAEPPPRRKGK